jgi:diguanylate cyclase
MDSRLRGNDNELAPGIGRGFFNLDSLSLRVMTSQAPMPASNGSEEYEYAKQSLAFMEQHAVVPTPENYAVWFHYVVAKNKELVHEINHVLSNKLKFTNDVCSYLYNKYIVVNRNQKVLDDAAISAQKVLLEVLRVVNDFSGTTENYNKGVDQYIDRISAHVGDDSANVKSIVKELVEATVSLKQSGESIQKKLTESTQEINTLRKDLQQVTIEAQRDFLTGVFNRKTFEKVFDEMAIRLKESHKDMCLLMLDIDHFKRFNDKFGHLLGDEVLKIVARALTDVLKGRDIVARFGGEEFVVILPDTPIDGAMKVAEVIRKTIADKELKRKDTGENYGSLTVSIGVARLRQSDTLPTLLKRADDALYQSKDMGRNRVTRGAD